MSRAYLLRLRLHQRRGHHSYSSLASAASIAHVAGRAAAEHTCEHEEVTRTPGAECTSTACEDRGDGTDAVSTIDRVSLVNGSHPRPSSTHSPTPCSPPAIIEQLQQQVTPSPHLQLTRADVRSSRGGRRAARKEPPHTTRHRRMSAHTERCECCLCHRDRMRRTTCVAGCGARAARHERGPPPQHSRARSPSAVCKRQLNTMLVAVVASCCSTGVC